MHMKELKHWTSVLKSVYQFFHNGRVQARVRHEKGDVQLAYITK